MIDSPRTPVSAWRRNFHRLWFAQSTSLVGLQAGSVAVPLLAVDALHATTSQVALIETLASVPWLIAPVIGTIADRTNRKRLLVLAHLGRSLLWLTIPAAYLLGLLALPQLWLVVLLVGVLSVVFGVGYRTFLPSVVPKAELGAANGKMAGTDAVARTTGPAFAGYLIQLIGAPWTILVQTTTLLLAGASTNAIKASPAVQRELQPTRRSRAVAGWWRDVTGGFRILYGTKPLRWLTLVETAYLFCFDICFSIVVVFFRTNLGLRASTIGVIFSAGSVGGILGAIVANRVRARIGFDSSIKVAAVIRGVGLVALPLSVMVPHGAAVVVVLIAGRALNACAWSVYDVLADTYQQSTLPDSRRGSATAASLWLAHGAETIGAAGAAAAATVVGTATLLTGATVGAAGAGLISLLVNTRSARGQGNTNRRGAARPSR